MKITNITVSGPTLAAQTTVEETAPAGEDQAAAGAPAESAYTPSTQLQQLTDLARQQPAIRDSLVKAASHRLKHGHYHSRASAEETASALMKALD